MDLRQLELLCALAREKHFGRAAKNCNISQPAFSARIRQLENELGVPIVQRERSFQGLTTEGELVVTTAQRILAEARTLKQSLSQMSKGLAGHLRIGAIPSAMPMMSLIKNPFCAAHPNITISLLSLSSVEIQLGLEKFDLEVGVTYLSKELTGNIETHELYQEEYSLIHNANGPLKDRKSITWQEAAELPLSLLTPDMQYRRIIDKTFEELDCHITPHTQTNSITQLLHETRFGNTSSIVPIGLIHVLRNLDGVVAIPLSEPRLINKIAMVIAKREPGSPIALEFFKHTKRQDVQKLLREASEKN
ncbi:LysR family transcriptional regulator [Kiloniella laminariae]|uniref:LysR family transcriptional regulator n=1 Tax=Kiloniella laminariae TaxID=454162 RepID=A0ABT4LE82_9PROT|nr:LysR family transcriptional regulator [Kiloniella laminariae]